MSKTSRIILWCVMVAVLALCVVLYISTKQTAADTTARDAGKRYAESLQAGDETPVITGGDFTITAHTFENMRAQNRASGMTEAEATQYTLVRYIVTRSLYAQAVAEGYAAADAAVDAQNITLAAPYSWTLTRDNYNDAGTWPELTPSTATPG